MALHWIQFVALIPFGAWLYALFGAKERWQREHWAGIGFAGMALLVLLGWLVGVHE